MEHVRGDGHVRHVLLRHSLQRGPFRVGYFSRDGHVLYVLGCHRLQPRHIQVGYFRRDFDDRKFSGADAFNGDLSNWNTSAVTDMSYMFDGATSFNGDMSSWDTSAVTSMMMMFTKAYAFNQDISNWDVMAVTNNVYMFGPNREDEPPLREENSPCTATGVGADGRAPWRKCGRTRPLATEADIFDEAAAIEPAAAAAADDRAGTAAGVWEGADGATWEDDGWFEDQLMSVIYTGPIPRRA